MRTVSIVAVVLVFALSLVVAQQRTPTGHYDTYGVGGDSTCGQWMATTTPAVHVVQLQWVLGFVSGASYLQAVYPERLAARTPLRTSDASRIESAISSYCKQNPTRSLTSAASQVMLDLVP